MNLTVEEKENPHAAHAKYLEKINKYFELAQTQVNETTKVYELISKEDVRLVKSYYDEIRSFYNSLLLVEATIRGLDLGENFDLSYEHLSEKEGK